MVSRSYRETTTMKPKKYCLLVPLLQQQTTENCKKKAASTTTNTNNNKIYGNFLLLGKASSELRDISNFQATLTSNSPFMEISFSLFFTAIAKQTLVRIFMSAEAMERQQQQPAVRCWNFPFALCVCLALRFEVARKINGK